MKVSTRPEPETSSRGSRPSSATPWGQNAESLIKPRGQHLGTRTSQKAKQNWREHPCHLSPDFQQPTRTLPRDFSGPAERDKPRRRRAARPGRRDRDRPRADLPSRCDTRPPIPTRATRRRSDFARECAHHFTAIPPPYSPPLERSDHFSPLLATLIPYKTSVFGASEHETDGRVPRYSRTSCIGYAGIPPSENRVPRHLSIEELTNSLLEESRHSMPGESETPVLEYRGIDELVARECRCTQVRRDRGPELTRRTIGQGNTNENNRMF